MKKVFDLNTFVKDSIKDMPDAIPVELGLLAHENANWTLDVQGMTELEISNMGYSIHEDWLTAESKFVRLTKDGYKDLLLQAQAQLE